MPHGPPSIVSTSIPVLLLAASLHCFTYDGEEAFSSTQNTFAGFFLNDFSRYKVTHKSKGKRPARVSPNAARNQQS
jgi:hypothetical protein